MTFTFLLQIALSMASTEQAAATPLPTGEAEIRFVGRGGIRSFHADGSRALYIQDRRRLWYRATLDQQCLGLEFGTAIGVQPYALDTLAAKGWVLTGRDRCQIRSLVRSDPPPPKPAKVAKAAKATKPAEP